MRRLPLVFVQVASLLGLIGCGSVKTSEGMDGGAGTGQAGTIGRGGQPGTGAGGVAGTVGGGGHAGKMTGGSAGTESSGEAGTVGGGGSAGTGVGGQAGTLGIAGHTGMAGASGLGGIGGGGGTLGQQGGAGGGCPAPQAGGGTRFVDHALGTDDEMHGGGTGPCAYKTLTYALKKAPGEISLSSADTYKGGVAGEKLPFLLLGQQTLSCNGASLENDADMGTYDGIVQFAGTRNAASGCNFDGGKWGGYCLVVNATAATASAPHVITKNSFTGCDNVTIVVPSGFDHVTITQNSFTLDFACIYPMGAHSDITIANNTFVGTNTDVVCDDAAPGVTGSGNVRGGGAIACSTCGGCPF
jgi:Right handed beta helix region